MIELQKTTLDTKAWVNLAEILWARGHPYGQEEVTLPKTPREEDNRNPASGSLPTLLYYIASSRGDFNAPLLPVASNKQMSGTERGQGIYYDSG